MRIVFTPQRGGLRESLDDSRVFNSLKELFIFASDSFDGSCSIKDISIKYYCFHSVYDVDCFILLAYSFPVGFVFFGLTKACMSRRLFEKRGI